MELPESIVQKYSARVQFQKQSGVPRNEREEHITKFLECINPARLADGFKPYTPGRVATMLAGVPTGDLYAFYRKCEQAKNFGKKFHWELKPQPKA